MRRLLVILACCIFGFCAFAEQNQDCHKANKEEVLWIISNGQDYGLDNRTVFMRKESPILQKSTAKQNLSSFYANSWIYILSGFLIGAIIGILFFNVFYVKKLKIEYGRKEGELLREKSILSNEKTKVCSELSRLRLKTQNLEREYNKLFDENVSLGEKIDDLEAAQFHTNKNSSEGTTSVFTAQVSSQKPDLSTTLYADAIIDDFFIKVSEIPTEDSIFVLHLKGETEAVFSILKPVYQRVIANPSFVEGCDIQIVGGATELVVGSEGKAQLERIDGKWRIINKLKVIIR